MVSVLTRLFGFPNIEQAEDIVQDTLLKALETWKYGRIPDNPQAWLYRVAKNHAIDLIRREKLKYKIESELAPLLRSEYTLVPAVNEMFSEHEIRDSMLRMMFACCHPMVSREAQIMLILRTLCGLSAGEIANAFLTKEDTVNKRLYRTKEKIRNEHIALDYPVDNDIRERTGAVLKTLYLLFNEGYNSSHPEQLIREDLCEEAMRLTLVLTENNKTDIPETNALLALMCYQVSRFNARLNDKGFIVLLKDQDRTQWNKYMIEKGNKYLHRSSAGNMVHEFHIEAAIASVHSNATSYETTDWRTILGLYDRLLLATNNPVVALNRCVVLAEIEGSEKGILELERLTGLEDNCHYAASLAEMYFRAGNKQKAESIFNEALQLTTSNMEIELLERQIKKCRAG